MPPPETSSAKSKGAKASIPEPKARGGQSASEVALKECEAIEAELAALKVVYEHYFLGNERFAPLRAHEDLKKRFQRLQASATRNTAVKFRVQALNSKMLTYERLWNRTLQEIENGTYKRDVLKAKRRASTSPESSKKQKGAVELPEEVESFEEIAEALEAATASPPAVTPAVAPVVPPPAPVVAPVVAPLAPVVPPVAPASKGLPPMTPPLAPATPPPAPVSSKGLPLITPPLAPGATPPPPPGAPRTSTSTQMRAVQPPPPPGAVQPPPPPGAAQPPPPPGAVQPPPPPGAPRTSTSTQMRAAQPPPPPGARPATPPPPPGSAPPRPQAAPASTALSDDKLRAVYDAYVTAKRRCQEDTSKMSYENVAATLRKQVPELLKQSGASAVEFKVVIKDGKALLKAVPK